jgi:hypothetical protein
MEMVYMQGVGILAAHLADQISDLARKEWSSGLAAPHLPDPEQSKCQATTVSGLTMANAECQPPQRQIHNRRSPEANFGRFFADRLSTPIWWRRAKFSSSREAREQNIEDRVARSLEREMGIRGE